MPSIDDILKKYRELAKDKEESLLHSKAAFSKNHIRNQRENEDYRLPYKNDVERIIHSKAYARYADKTQVVYLVDNDHITHRALHVQLVSCFSRGLAEILHLNVDLVEAIALGHDVGHPPFGHEGEEYLSKLSEEYGNGPFTHSLQSCRLLSEIEPLNLGLAVYDGFLCHDGGMCGTILKPQFDKTWSDHLKDKEKKRVHPDLNIMPGTLEGCLVKLCDTMSYLGRDIEDAIQLGILSRESVPKTLLGNTNRQILNGFAQDLIKNSSCKDSIALSDEIYQAMGTLREFNFKNIYTHQKLKIKSQQIKKSYRILFELLLQDLEKEDENSYVWKNFLHNKNEKYLKGSSAVQKIIDYISGMTDGYFVKTLEKLVVPQRIELC